jgi:hypothetical protein
MSYVASATVPLSGNKTTSPKGQFGTSAHIHVSVFELGDGSQSRQSDPKAATA